MPQTIRAKGIGTERKAVLSSIGQGVDSEVRLNENGSVGAGNASPACRNVSIVHSTGFGKAAVMVLPVNPPENDETVALTLTDPDNNLAGERVVGRSPGRPSVAVTIPTNDNRVRFAPNLDADVNGGNSIALRTVASRPAPAEGRGLTVTGEMITAPAGIWGDNAQTVVFAAGQARTKTAEFTMALDADTDDERITFTLTVICGGPEPGAMHTISVQAPLYRFGFKETAFRFEELTMAGTDSQVSMRVDAVGSAAKDAMRDIQPDDNVRPGIDISEQDGDNAGDAVIIGRRTWPIAGGRIADSLVSSPPADPAGQETGSLGNFAGGCVSDPELTRDHALPNARRGNSQRPSRLKIAIVFLDERKVSHGQCLPR